MYQTYELCVKPSEWIVNGASRLNVGGSRMFVRNFQQGSIKTCFSSQLIWTWKKFNSRGGKSDNFGVLYLCSSLSYLIPNKWRARNQVESISTSLNIRWKNSFHSSRIFLRIECFLIKGKRNFLRRGCLSFGDICGCDQAGNINENKRSKSLRICAGIDIGQFRRSYCK